MASDTATDGVKGKVIRLRSERFSGKSGDLEGPCGKMMEREERPLEGFKGRM